MTPDNAIPIVVTAPLVLAVLWTIISFIDLHFAEQQFARLIGLRAEDIGFRMSDVPSGDSVEQLKIDLQKFLPPLPAGSTRTEAARILFLALTTELSPSHRRAIRRGLEQPSARGRAAYVAKLWAPLADELGQLAQSEPEPVPSRR